VFPPSGHPGTQRRQDTDRIEIGFALTHDNNALIGKGFVDFFAL
jgi:hypothetical protein